MTPRATHVSIILLRHRTHHLVWYHQKYKNTVDPNYLVMSPLYRGGDILSHLSPLICSSDLLFCVCAFFPSILQAVKHETVLCLCILSVYSASGQAQDIDPMSGYCWPTVYDAQPTLAQYWVTVSCLTPHWMCASVTDGEPTLTQLWFKASWPYRQHAGTFCMYVAYDRPGRHEEFARWWYSAGPQSAAPDRRCTGVVWTNVLFCCDDDGGYCSVDSTHWPSVDLVQGRRWRRWTSIESALGLFLLFAGLSDDEKI